MRSLGILDLAKVHASVSAASLGLLSFWPLIARPGQASRHPKRAPGWLSSHWRGSLLAIASRAGAALAPATRRQRELVFKKVAATAGADTYTNVTRQTVMAGLCSATPFIERDPTEGVHIPLPRTDGFHSWTEDEIAQFEARWPIGTRERLALTILLYTGLRRGDAVRLGRQHIKDGIITLRAGKTGTQIIIPVLPELAAVINSSRTGDLPL